MVYDEENDVYNIQTFDLTKRFTKKNHRSIFGFYLTDIYVRKRGSLAKY